MDFNLILKNYPIILQGLDNTILLVFLSLSIGFIISIFFALARISKYKWLSKLIYSYVFIIRGTPLLVQIYLIYFGLGQLQVIRDSILWIILKEPFYCGLLALVINTVAYTSEIIRGGIESVSKGQKEACKALGMNKFIMYYKIILPVAFRQALPSYGNEMILMVKATSLVSLTISENSAITNIPSSIDYLSDLTNLNIRGIGFDQGLPSLTSLPYLTSINLGYNGLTELPNLPTSIVTVTADNNNLISLPSSINNLLALHKKPI